MASDERSGGCFPTLSKIVRDMLKTQAQVLLERMRARHKEKEFMYIHNVQFFLYINSQVDWKCGQSWAEELVQLFREKPATRLVFDFLARDHLHRFIRREESRAPFVFTDGHDSTHDDQRR